MNDEETWLDMTEGGAPLIADVVVPVHGHADVAARCISSLLGQDEPVNVIVVDDASPDDTAERLRKAFPNLTIIELKDNVGFARACNIGIRAGVADVVVLVNSDVEASPDMTSLLVDALKVNGVGSAFPLLLAPDGSVDSFGIVADVTLAGFVRYHGAPVDVVVDDTRWPAVGPYGAVAAYRRTALSEVGLLDENIFMYGEELELAFRLRAAGWRSAAVRAARGVHVGGVSSGLGSPRQRYLSAFGRGYTLRLYRVHVSRFSLRANITEFLVVMSQLIRARDTVGLRGRWAGWKAARGLPARRRPDVGLDESISMGTSLRMRSAGFWAR